ncbi:NB-ARC domain-containing protein [Kitasatospora sp. SolWspMP-SS2h]|uniref:ATP-binding protein n=1 Tax=Kitasatospora sp. SolWspMP-SS2h TaxID=1305729 RepID=UPI000DB9A94D|nr:BTAD domain-containing putative transcriptional regulator [Kitasatospora sp. SolWspMP-SS2h]RAJ44699.1 NB-ARC domain-containing protein [Kitasatospora sp. SolWspMP-SS2h]
MLAVGPGELDLEVFGSAADRAAAARFSQDWDAWGTETERALALWRGEPFTGLPSLLDSPTAVRLVETRLRLLEWCADLRLRGGPQPGLVAQLAALAAEHPLREVFHRQLMLALHRAGRTPEALDVYHALRRRLAEELGIDPGPEVRDALQVLLTLGRESASTSPAATASPAAATSPATATGRTPKPFQLPRDTADFIGREQPLRLLRDALLRVGDATASGGTASGGAASGGVVVISGMGGVGKTALAVHAGHLLRAHYPDGQLHADLRGYCGDVPRDPHGLLGRFLTDLGVPGSAVPDHTDDRASLYRATLADRRVLILLDNARESAQIDALLPGVGPSAVLVTSRHTLAGTEAVRIPLAPLGPEAHTLLAGICGSERIAADPVSADRIVAACGGLPLALRIAGARIATRPAWPLSALASRLAEPRHRLGALALDDLAVRDAFAMSYHALVTGSRPVEQEAARLFRLLGLWSATPLSLEAVSALADRDPVETADLLDVLYDAHLIEAPTAHSYRFHDLLAGYADELVRAEEAPGERDAATLRLLTWYTVAVEHAESLCWPVRTPPEETRVPLPELGTAEDALGWLRREMPAIREAVARAGGSGRPELAWRIATHLNGYGNSYWWEGAWQAVVSTALDTARAVGDREAQAGLYGCLAAALGCAGRDDESLEHLLTAERILTGLGKSRGVACMVANQALVHKEAGRLADGFAAVHRALRLFEAAGETEPALALHTLAGLHLAAGDARAAERTYRQVLGVFRRRGLTGPTGATLVDLGDTLRVLDRRDEALAALGEALAIARTLDDRHGIAAALEATARAHAHFGEAEQARHCRLLAFETARVQESDHTATTGTADPTALDQSCAAR